MVRVRTITEVARMGGKARSARLSPEARKRIARLAIAARWAKSKARKQAAISAALLLVKDSP